MSEQLLFGLYVFMLAAFVGYMVISKVPALLHTQGLAKNAQHPHAALLFLDYLFSEDGQRLLQQADYLPAHPGVPAKVPSLKPEQGNFKVNFISPEDSVKSEKDWDQVFRRLFMQGG